MLFDLFITFFKIGLFTFGGGYAMIPLIKEQVVDKKKWISEDELLEIIAIAESTPGPIAINMATYIGFKQKKILGSILTTLGVVLPSIIIIVALSYIYEAFMSNMYVKYAFVGIKCAVSILIIKAGINMIKKMKKNVINIIVLVIVCLLMFSMELFNFSFSSIFTIIAGGIIGLIVFSINKARKKEMVGNEQ